MQQGGLFGAIKIVIIHLALRVIYILLWGMIHVSLNGRVISMQDWKTRDMLIEAEFEHRHIHGHLISLASLHS